MSEQVQANNKLQLELQVLRARIQQLELQQGIIVQERNNALEKVQEVCNCWCIYLSLYFSHMCFVETNSDTSIQGGNGSTTYSVVQLQQVYCIISYWIVFLCMYVS